MALDEFFRLEDTSDSREPLPAVQSPGSATDKPNDILVELSNDENEFGFASTQAASVCSFIRAAHEPAKYLKLLVEEAFNVGGEGRSHALLQLVADKARALGDFLQKCLAQTRIKDFFRTPDCQSIQIS